ncbi:hypothetical protein T4B_14265 [Trichinella pseudospiralis]|uniref:Uncharacterized protein n=1 Tax=Trichinella pseudospiralis TaxID=6337 RepID=A0A0V1KAI5_TRIPS|nr:hypothetical protein T4B_14265 [Trichinella pseudospiralis]KRZ44230.1 hypothetical protein T4C_7478 [Trichinella pseudospiralis]
MFFLCPTKDDDVLQLPQSGLHQELECCRGVAQVEWHDAGLKETQERGKRGLLTITLCQYPDARSSVLNHWVPASVSKVSSIRGIGCASPYSACDSRRRIGVNHPSSAPGLPASSMAFPIATSPE